MANYKYYLKKITQPNEDLVVLDLADPRGKPVFNYKPGQYAMISYFDEAGKMKQRHAFSIASSPSRNDHLTLGIRLGGTFTKGLLNLKIGSPITVAGPYGNFIFNPQKHKDLVLIAGGIGITPFFSAMNYATDNNLANRISLLYCARTLQSMTFLKEIKQLEARNPNLRTLLAITNEAVPVNTPGVINGKINSQVINEFVGEVNNKDFFICGPLGFMEAVKNSLFDLGVYKSQIAMEAFTMLDEEAWWPQVKNLSYATAFSAAAVAIIFYSIVNAQSLANTIKTSGSNFFKPDEVSNQINSNSNYNSGLVQPTPMTSVSGMPSGPNNNFNQQLNSLTPSANNNQLSLNTNQSAPSPITSSSIPAVTKTAANSVATKSTAATAAKPAVVATPSPVTSASTPLAPTAGTTVNQSTAVIANATPIATAQPTPVTSASTPAVSTNSNQQLTSSNNQIISGRHRRDEEEGDD